MKSKTLVSAAVLALSSLAAQAEIVVQWNFNTDGTTPQLKASYTYNGEQSPSLGGVGGVSLTNVSGFGSTDTEIDNDALNTSSYPAQGSGDLTRGIEFFVDTTGFENLVLSFDQRNSNTASAWTTLLYTLDGSSWTNAASFQMLSGGSFTTGRSFDFSAIAGADNNPMFGVQLLASFAPGSAAYAGTAGNYGSSGTIRYDMLTLSGDVVTAVPEPQSLALMLGGLGLVGLSLRRRLG